MRTVAFGEQIRFGQDSKRIPGRHDRRKSACLSAPNFDSPPRYIVSPDYLKDHVSDVVIIMNSIYTVPKKS